MFRATAATSCLSNLKLPSLLNPVAFSSSLKSPLQFSISYSTKPPILLLQRSVAQFSVVPSFSPFRRRIASMLGSNSNSKSKGRVQFSAASSEIDGKELLVQHLLVAENNLNLLLELQKKIAEGMDLSDLAVEHSVCPSKENGGMLGWIRRGQTVPEFEEAAFSAPLNKIVRCKTKFGWHLLQVLSEREECLIKDIQPEELHLKLQDPSFLDEAQLIDVREPEEVTQASLPGFKVLPLRQFGTWGSVISDEFDPEKKTYVLCHHGVRSLQVAYWLQTQGFKRVFNVAGGIHAYSVKADPSIPKY